MIEVRQTEMFSAWLAALADDNARTRIATRITRLRSGLFGDVKPVGRGVSELRIDYGPGYRLYLVRRGNIAVVLLCGGDKRTQKRDINAAIRMAGELE